MLTFNFFAIIGIVVAIIVLGKKEERSVRIIPVYMFLGLLVLDAVVFFAIFPIILKVLGIYIGFLLGILMISAIFSLPLWGAIGLGSILAKLSKKD